MITRIVMMSFRDEETENFIQIFKETAKLIRTSNGCLEVRLLRDIGNVNVFFTLSKWQSEEHLNIYRSSDLFKTTWARVKPLFSEKAQAWSVEDFF